MTVMLTTAVKPARFMPKRAIVVRCPSTALRVVI
jgi:hypothetical protein